MKKLLSVFLFCVICFVSVFSVGSGLNANAYTAHTVEEAITYLHTLVGEKIGTGQCVALIVDYYQYLGVPRSYGDGKDYATNTLPSGWSRIKGAMPQKGDIMIWTGTTYGHVAICGGEGVYFHQNWDGLYVSIKNKSYTSGYNIIATGEHADYWGVIRPDFENSNQLSVSNPWIKTSENGIFIGESISFTFGADNALSYDITIKHHDDVVKKESDVKSGISYSFTEEGSYTAYITAKNGSATVDSSTVEFYVVDALDMGSYFITKIKNPVLGHYVALETSNSNVYLASETTNGNNEWKFIRQEDLSYKVINVKTGDSLGISDLSTENGTNIGCYPSNNSDYQRWYIRKNLSGYALVPKVKLSSDLSITGNGWIYGDCIFDGANISLYENDSVQSQRFSFEYIVEPINEWLEIDKTELTSNEKIKFSFNSGYTKKYTLHVEFADGSVLETDINSGELLSFEKSGKCEAYIMCTLEDGNIVNTEKVYFYNMKIYDFGEMFTAKIKNTTSGFYVASKKASSDYYDVFVSSQELCDNNVWNFVRQEDGSYKIINRATGFVLSLDGEKAEDKTNIICNYDNNEDNQKWFITSNIDGYAFAPKKDFTKYLSVYDNDTIWWYGTPTDGAEILLYDLDNVQSQRFELVDYLVYGDADGDQQVTTSDLAILKLYLAGSVKLESVSETLSDLNSDGTVNTTDLADLKLFLAGVKTF